MPTTSYTSPLTPAQADALRDLLDRQGFEFKDKPYTLFAAAKGKLNIAVYEKGPKVLVQGKETEDFVINYLEPEILGEAKLGYEDVHHPDWFQPHFGIDESGKGDFFGPLVIAGVYTDETITRALLETGIKDSKKITSDNRILTLAEKIRAVPGIAFDIIRINPARYNELYQSFRNLNRLLAWGHARVIANLTEKVPACPRALSDQFAGPRELERALAKQLDGASIQLEQRTKAESDPAVAAASILARECFIHALADLASQAGLDEPLPRGASQQVQQTMSDIIRAGSRDDLAPLAKLHFRFAAELN